jgi:hypothetical protein
MVVWTSFAETGVVPNVGQVDAGEDLVGAVPVPQTSDLQLAAGAVFDGFGHRTHHHPFGCRRVRGSLCQRSALASTILNSTLSR